MSAVTVAVAVRSRAGGAPIMHAITGNGRAYPLMLTPGTLALTDGGWTWADTARQGRVPIRYRDAPTPTKASFTHTMAAVASSRDRVPVSRRISDLLAIKAAGMQVRFVGCPTQLGGWWWIDGIDLAVTALDEAQQIRIADLSWTLTAVVDQVKPGIGKTAPPPQPTGTQRAPGGGRLAQIAV